MTTKCYFSARDIAFEELGDGFRITIITDTPCHLYMRWTNVKPRLHDLPVFKRGIFMHGDRYFCFVAYHDNEQEEAGDTLIHTFTKRGWFYCETRYFYFWGSVAGNTCVSTTAVFEKHSKATGPATYLPCWHNRIIRSNWGTWSIARSGFHEEKFGLYQRPQSIQRVETYLTLSYWVIRSFDMFDTQNTPPGKSVIDGRLGIYVTEKQGLSGAIFITKGLWTDPVTREDFEPQTNETTILGRFELEDLVLNAYNWADLNQAGLDWINQRPTELNQHESNDFRQSAWGLIYAEKRWSQNFTPQTNHTITSLKLRLRRDGTPGDFFVDIWDTTPGGCPGENLLSQCRLDGNSLSTLQWGSWIDAILDTPVELVAGTTYAIQIWAPDADADDLIRWVGATANNYPNGNSCYSPDGGVTWIPNYTFDMHFIEYDPNLIGGTKFCLRTDYDLSDVPPIMFADHRIAYHSAQKGAGFYPLLELHFG